MIDDSKSCSSGIVRDGANMTIIFMGHMYGPRQQEKLVSVFTYYVRNSVGQGIRHLVHNTGHLSKHTDYEKRYQ